jgi:hypothetical protein
LLFSCCDSVAALPALANCNERRCAAGKGPGTTIKYLRCTTSGATGNGLGTTINDLQQKKTSGAVGNGLSATIKHLRRTTSGAAGCSLGTTIKYLLGATGTDLGNTIKHLRRTSRGAAGNNLGATAKYLRSSTAGSKSPTRRLTCWSQVDRSSSIRNSHRQ